MKAVATKSVGQSVGKGVGTHLVLELWGWKSMIELPLVIEGRSVGLIEVADYRSSRRWSGRDIAFCQTIASQAAMAVRNAQLYEDLQRRADRDSLTDLLNHRAYYDRLAQELARCQRDGSQVGVMAQRTVQRLDGVGLRLQGGRLGWVWQLGRHWPRAFGGLTPQKSVQHNTHTPTIGTRARRQQSARPGASPKQKPAPCCAIIGSSASNPAAIQP